MTHEAGSDYLIEDKIGGRGEGTAWDHVGSKMRVQPGLLDLGQGFISFHHLHHN